MKWLVLLLLPAQAWAAENVAVIYDGFGSRAGYVVEGRVIEVERRSPSQIGDGKGRNLLRNIRTLKNDEKEGVALTLQIESEVAQAVTDDEGFFRVVVKTTQLPTDGWHSVQAQGNHARGEGQLLLVPMENTLGIISDIDDTVLVSEVTSKRKLLKNTFLKNSLQRKTFPCTAMFSTITGAECTARGCAGVLPLGLAPAINGKSATISEIQPIPARSFDHQAREW